jgi:hypothetical protein
MMFVGNFPLAIIFFNPVVNRTLILTFCPFFNTATNNNTMTKGYIISCCNVQFGYFKLTIVSIPSIKHLFP